MQNFEITSPQWLGSGFRSALAPSDNMLLHFNPEKLTQPPGHCFLLGLYFPYLELINDFEEEIDGPHPIMIPFSPGFEPLLLLMVLFLVMLLQVYFLHLPYSTLSYSSPFGSPTISFLCHHLGEELRPNSGLTGNGQII